MWKLGLVSVETFKFEMTARTSVDDSEGKKPQAWCSHTEWLGCEKKLAKDWGRSIGWVGPWERSGKEKESPAWVAAEGEVLTVQAWTGNMRFLSDVNSWGCELHWYKFERTGGQKNGYTWARVLLPCEKRQLGLWLWGEWGVAFLGSILLLTCLFLSVSWGSELQQGELAGVSYVRSCGSSGRSIYLTLQLLGSKVTPTHSCRQLAASRLSRRPRGTPR